MNAYAELDTDYDKSMVQTKLIGHKILETLSDVYRLTFSTLLEAEHIVEHQCTASIGVSLFQSHDLSQQDILKRANIAMHQAKSGGRNRVCCFEEMP